MYLGALQSCSSRNGKAGEYLLIGVMASKYLPRGVMAGMYLPIGVVAPLDRCCGKSVPLPIGVVAGKYLPKCVVVSKYPLDGTAGEEGEKCSFQGSTYRIGGPARTVNNAQFRDR